MTSIEIAATRIMHPARTWWRPGIAPSKTLLLATAAGSLLWLAPAAPHPEHTAIVMAAIFVASLVGGIAGFAFSAVAGGILFHLQDDPVRLVAIMITCSIANQAAMTWAVRQMIDWRSVSRYLAGGALGLWIGIWFLLHADRMLYTRLLGGFLLAYGGFMLLRKAIVIRRDSPILDVVAGFLGGITGGAAAFPGAFVSIWCGMKGWPKTRQRAVVQPFILITQLAGLLVIGLLQPSHAGRGALNPADLMFIPASLLGTAVGLALYGRLTDVQFGRAVNALLIASGLTFIL